jgi:Nucleotidyltransferase of unknown function (DUF6036)
LNADDRLVLALRDVSSALREIRAPSMIIGGLAVIAGGFARYTHDVDAVVRGRDSDVKSVLEAFANHRIGFRDPDARRAAAEKQVLFLRHESGVNVDVGFAWFPFEEQALDRAAQVDLNGVRVRVALPEDLILYKATAWRPQDQQDVLQLLLLHLNTIDVGRIRALLEEIAAVLGDSQRVAEFDRLVERARRARR